METSLQELIKIPMSFEEADKVIKLTDLVIAEMQSINKTKETVLKQHDVKPEDVNQNPELRQKLDLSLKSYLSEDVKVEPFTIKGIKVQPIWIKHFEGVIKFS